MDRLARLLEDITKGAVVFTAAALFIILLNATI